MTILRLYFNTIFILIYYIKILISKLILKIKILLLSQAIVFIYKQKPIITQLCLLRSLIFKI